MSPIDMIFHRSSTQKLLISFLGQILDDFAKFTFSLHSDYIKLELIS